MYPQPPTKGPAVDVLLSPDPICGCTVVTVTGQLDIDTAQQFRDGLAPVLDRPAPRIVVNLSGLTFTDSIGLSALAVGHNRCAAAGGFLRLAEPTPFLLRVLTVVGLSPTLQTYRTVEAACVGDPTARVFPAPPALS
jgi:anti-anti-sigma factor